LNQKKITRLATVITLLSGMQLIYNRDKKLIITIGFVKKNKTRYGYCSNFYENKYSDNATYYYRKIGLKKIKLGLFWLNPASSFSTCGIFL
jgi:hypothetical protein